MGAHADLVAFLNGNVTISAAAPGGIFHEFYPQSQREFPVLLYRLVSWSEFAPDMDYPEGGTIQERRFQIDVVGLSSGEVTDSIEVIDAELTAFSGTMGSSTVQRIERSTASDLGEIRNDKQRRRASADYIIWYD